MTRLWVYNAIRELEADATRSADTHLLRFPLPPEWGIDLYVKDESSHPTGSLKHRLARSLFLYGLVGGRVGPTTTVVDASSGSTAVSEAYFAALLGLRFVAVVPTDVSAEKVRLIEEVGGACEFVGTSAEVSSKAEEIAGADGGYYLNQFGLAAIATDWRGNNNIACSIFNQMSAERHPEPAWIVAGAGTGGTSSTIGRYIRYRRKSTQVAVGDPEGSVYADAWRSRRTDLIGPGSRIEGIGRPRVEPSFCMEAIDHVRTVPDCASIAGMRVVHGSLGIRPGPSTGTNFALALDLIEEMRHKSQTGSVVMILGDRGDRYLDTFYDDAWLRAQGITFGADLERMREQLRAG